MRLDGKTFGVGFGVLIVGVAIGFFVHRCQCPADGNPIGYHLHGLAVVDRTKLDLAGCQTAPGCTLIINIATGKGGSPAPSAQATPCPASNNCIAVTGNALLLSSTDSSTPHPEETAKAFGVVELVLPSAKGR